VAVWTNFRVGFDGFFAVGAQVVPDFFANEALDGKNMLEYVHEVF